MYRCVIVGLPFLLLVYHGRKQRNSTYFHVELAFILDCCFLMTERDILLLISAHVVEIRVNKCAVTSSGGLSFYIRKRGNLE